MRSVGEPEASFYRDLAGDIGVRTLRNVWADVHPETHHGVVITEDVAAAGGVFRDALSPCSVEQTASLLGELAHLHAHTWENRRPADVPWLAPRATRTLEARGAAEIRRNLESPLGTGVPGDVGDPERLVEAFRVLATRRPGAGWAVIHGDTHVGSALEPPVRAAAERDLLGHYLDRLRSYGVAAPSFDVAWDEYRGAMAYGFFLWGITIYVQPDVIAALLHRLGTAVSELGSYEVLGRRFPQY